MNTKVEEVKDEPSSSRLEEPEELPDLPDSTTEFLSCLVCGRTPGFRFYGSICCYSCKSFFLRAAITKKQLHCPTSGCNFLKSRCRACRFEKCLKVGMIPEIVGRRVDSTLRLEKPSTSYAKKMKKIKEEIDSSGDEVECYSPDTTVNSTKASTIVKNHLLLPALVFPKPFRLPALQNNHKAVQALVNVERMCLFEDSPLKNQIDFKFNVQVGIVDLLINPTVVCPRVPMGFQAIQDTEVCPPNFIGRCFVRAMLYLVDWVRSNSEFNLMPMIDRIQFCARLFPIMYPLQIFYYTYKAKCEGVLTGLGGQYIEEGSPLFGSDSDIRNFYKPLCDLTQGTVIPLLNDIGITEDEYVVLKNVLMFSSSLGLSESSAFIVRNARRRYEAMLVETVCSRVSDAAKTVEVMGKIMQFVSIIQGLSQIATPYFARMTVMNTEGLRSQLTSEIWLNTL